MSGQKLPPSEARELGEQRESWCSVELKKEQDWCRKERKHHREMFSSSVFDQHTPQYEPRCTFTVDEPTHKERRHFKQQNGSQVNI